MIIKDTCLGNRQIRVLSNGGCEVQNEQGKNPQKFESLEAYITEITQAMQAIIPKEDNRKSEVQEPQDEVPSEPYAREPMNKMSVVKDDEKEGEVNELNAATSTKD